MIYEKIKLDHGRDTWLCAYVHDDTPTYGYEQGRPSIIILPGGAFAFLSPYEAEPVALTFLQKGFNTYVLYYTVGDECSYPEVLIECSEAIMLVRDRAETWHNDPAKVYLMGFSAGACLAGVSATQWNDPQISAALGVAPEYIRPDAAVIAYGCWDNSGTIWNDPEFVNPEASDFPKSCPPQLDMINYVGPHVCPLFVWHNQRDKYVPVRNALMIAEKLCELKIPVELHLYTGGEHGMSIADPRCCMNESATKLAEANPNIRLWPDLCANWLYAL